MVPSVLGLIPARGGSRGLPRKNLRLLLGRPLIAYTIAAARSAASLDRVVVSTDDAEIAAVARAEGAEVPFLRPAELATDAAATLPVVQHALAALGEHDGYAPDAVALLEPTAPLRSSEQVDVAVARLFEAGADAVVGVAEVPHHFHPFKLRVLRDDRLHRFMDLVPLPARRQDLPPLHYVNGAIYVTRTPVILGGSLYGDRICPLVMAREDSIDIDDEVDLLLAETLLARRSAHG